jgi:hypothetical protein
MAHAVVFAVPEARKEPGAGDEQEHVVVARVLAALKPRDDGDGKSASPPLQKHSGNGSSSSALPNPSLYRHQWRPRNTSVQPPRTGPLQPPAGPRILPPLHLLQQPACGSREAAAAAELVRMLERAMVRDRVAVAAEAMPSPCYYAPAAASAYHHGGSPAAPRTFAAGGYHAPAVSVRSVIPVCAAPPRRPPPPAKEERNGPATPSDACKRA